MALTNAQRQRATRQEALREQLKGKQLLTQYIGTLEKINELDEGEDLFDKTLSKLKTVNEQRLKLINKCLPDEKDINISGELEHSGGMTITWQQ